MIILGRVRTKDIKNAGEEMWKRYPERFGTDFETTKRDVNQLGLTLSKRVRNKMAGYITRHKKIQSRSAG